MVWYDAKWKQDHEVIVAENCLIFLLLLFTCLVCQNYLQKHFYYLPASGVTLLISMFIGGLLRLCNGISGSSTSQLQFASPFILGFSSNIFYFGLLPPILFYSGYYLKRRYFYRNIDSILTLAFLGTIISIIVITIGTFYYVQSLSSPSITEGLPVPVNELRLSDALLLATILSSTDPITTLAIYSNLSIDYNLYYIVFGESILNDAISVTMYNTLSELMDVPFLSNDHFLLISFDFLIIFALSSLLGYSIGIVVAYCLRQLHWFDEADIRSPGEVIPQTPPPSPNAVNDGTDSKIEREPSPSKINEVFSMQHLNPESHCPPFSPHSIASSSYQHRHSPHPISFNRHHEHAYHHHPYISHNNPHISATPRTFLATPSVENNQKENGEEMISILFLFFICYFSFFLSETFQLSGIVTIFFCGISTRRYIMKNMHYSIKVLFSKMMEMIAYLMETSCFIIMGLSIFLISFSAYDWKFIMVVFGSCIIGRVIQVYSLLSLVNLGRYCYWKAGLWFHRRQVGPPRYVQAKEMHMTVLAGLRGAMAYALAYSLPLSYQYRELFLATTAIIVLLTVFLFGGMTVPFIRWLNIMKNTEINSHNNEVTPFGYSELTKPSLSSKSFETSYIYPIVLRRFPSLSSFGQRKTKSLRYSPLPEEGGGSGGRIRKFSIESESSGGGSVRLDLPSLLNYFGDSGKSDNYLMPIPPEVSPLHHHLQSPNGSPFNFYSDKTSLPPQPPSCTRPNSRGSTHSPNFRPFMHSLGVEDLPHHSTSNLTIITMDTIEEEEDLEKRNNLLDDRVALDAPTTMFTDISEFSDFFLSEKSDTNPITSHTAGVETKVMEEI